MSTYAELKADYLAKHEAHHKAADKWCMAEGDGAKEQEEYRAAAAAMDEAQKRLDAFVLED